MQVKARDVNNAVEDSQPANPPANGNTILTSWLWALGFRMVEALARWAWTGRTDGRGGINQGMGLFNGAYLCTPSPVVVKVLRRRSEMMGVVSYVFI